MLQWIFTCLNIHIEYKQLRLFALNFYEWIVKYQCCHVHTLYVMVLAQFSTFFYKIVKFNSPCPVIDSPPRYNHNQHKYYQNSSNSDANTSHNPIFSRWLVIVNWMWKNCNTIYSITKVSEICVINKYKKMIFHKGKYILPFFLFCLKAEERFIPFIVVAKTDDKLSEAKWRFVVDSMAVLDV